MKDAEGLIGTGEGRASRPVIGGGADVVGMPAARWVDPTGELRQGRTFQFYEGAGGAAKTCTDPPQVQR